MIKTIIVLPDGTELSSGVGTQNAIQSVTITECVNGAQELTLGSCCANMIEAKLITPNGGLLVAAGDELTVFRVTDDGTRHKVGLFTTEKPTRPTANSMSITAYDRVSWLDRDLTQWLANLDDTIWPCALFDFAKMVCNECGLSLVNEEILNGAYQVQKFSAEGITGRQLMQWIGEICGSFCRATPEGDVEFAWYKPASLAIGPSTAGSIQISYDGEEVSIIIDAAVSYDGAGNVVLDAEGLPLLDDGQGNLILDARQYYFQNGLTFEDYVVATVEKVQLRQSEDDVGTVYPPDLAEEVNTYTISGNYLLTANTAEDLQPVAQSLYERLHEVNYTPCKVSIPASLLLHAGDTVQIIDRNGKKLTAYVMTKTQAGQKDTLECTGSPSRDSSSAVNSQSYKALTGKVLNLRSDVEGLKVEHADTNGRVAELSVEIGGIKTSVGDQEDAITTLQQTSEQLRIDVQGVKDNGAEKVKTATGYTFDESGLTIRRDDSEIENTLNHQGMYVSHIFGDKKEAILTADADGVNAINLTARKHLTIGANSRFEDYTDGTDTKRTACFFVGGLYDNVSD